MAIYEQNFESQDKADGSPVTAADLAASACIEEILAPLGIPITGEESDKAPFEQRQHWQQSWCIDPLDGTKEFIKRNGEFAVNIALIEKGIPVLSIVGIFNANYNAAEFKILDKEIILKQGDILLFPSNFMFPHQVKTIEKGTRYSFVTWAY